MEAITISRQEYKELLEKAVKYDLMKTYEKNSSYSTEFERIIFDLSEDSNDDAE